MKQTWADTGILFTSIAAVVSPTPTKPSRKRQKGSRAGRTRKGQHHHRKGIQQRLCFRESVEDLSRVVHSFGLELSIEELRDMVRNTEGAFVGQLLASVGRYRVLSAAARLCPSA